MRTNGFEAIAQTLERLGRTMTERLSEDDRAAVEDVLDAALECDERRLPLHAFAQIGTLQPSWRVVPSQSYSRMMAMAIAVPGDPRRDALRRCIDRLLIESGYVLTTHGLFEPAEIPPGMPVIGSYQKPQEGVPKR